MRRHDAVALWFLAAVITLLFADVLLGIHSFYIRDIAQYYFPAKKLLREIVLGGEFPYWNPFFHAGQPLAANPEHEVFYPLTWLILLPNYLLGFHLLILAHLYIAALAMYALLRSMAVRTFAAFVGALSFAIGGLVLSCINLLPILFSVVWMPLTLLFARRVLMGIGCGLRVAGCLESTSPPQPPTRNPQPLRDFALASFFLGLQCIVGEPTTVLQTGILLGIYALSSRPFGRRLGAVALISIGAVFVAAVQVLPAIDLFADSIRSRGIDFEVVSRWSMSPARLSELIFPKRVPPHDVPLFFSIYSGIVITVLAAAGLVARMRGYRLVLAIMSVSILLAVGNHTPLLRLLHDSGIGRSTRYPEKFILMTVFALIVFGARMLDRLLDDDVRLRRFALGAGALVTLLAIAAPQHLWRGAAVLILLWSVDRVFRPLWLGTAALFVIGDLVLSLFHVAPRFPSSYYRETPAAAQQFPPNRHELRLFHYADWTRQHNARGQHYMRPDADLYWRVRSSLSPMMPAAYGLRTVMEVDYDLTALKGTHDFVRSAWELSDLRPRDWMNVAAAMSNIWFVGVYERPEVALDKARRSERHVQPVRFLEGNHHPRYYFAPEIVTIRDRKHFVRELATGRRSKQAAFIREPSFVPAPGIVRGWREHANSARIDVETSGPSFMVMSVTAHKYWRVRIDGKEVPAMVTNLAYQGVIVPRGRHVVEMRYRNPLIAVGAVISAAALIALALLARRR